MPEQPIHTYTFDPISKILTLSSPTSSFAHLGSDIPELLLHLADETPNCLRVCLCDKEGTRWQVPSTAVPLNHSTYNKSEKKSHRFEFIHDPFSFAIVREEDGERIFDTTGFDFVFKDQFLQISSHLPEYPNIYGLGEVIAGFRRHTKGQGTRTTLWTRDAMTPKNENIYGAQPFYMEIRNGKAHGVLLLNSNGMDVYLQNSRITYKDVVQQYLSLVGFPQMPSLWNLGQHQCKWGYRTLQEVENVVEEYSKAKIPLDCVWLDIDHMDNYKNFTTDPVSYPADSMRAFIDTLHARNQRVVVIIDPGIKIEPGYDAYDAGLRLDVFIKKQKPDGDIRNFIGRLWPGLVCFPDWFHTNAKIYWQECLQNFINIFPVDGIWVDMNEVSNFGRGNIELSSDGIALDHIYGDTSEEELDVKPDVRPVPVPPFGLLNPPYRIGNYGQLESDLDLKTAPMDALHYGGIVEYDAHNLYGHMECQVTHAALKEIRPDQKPFILTRSNFTGTGRYAAHWLGDNSSDFSDLKESLAGILNYSIFGIPLVGADVAGFDLPVTEELHIRWTSLASIAYPFCRNHCSVRAPNQEPYLWSSVAMISRKYLHIRYALLPYWYTLFERAANKGETVMRPLFFEFPNDEETYGIEEQIMIGPGILVSPVVHKGKNSVRAYLPPSAVWFNFWTSKMAQSTSWIDLNAPLEHVPIHIRGGIILPMFTEPALTTHETKANSKIKLVVALDEKSAARGEVYLDDDSPMPAKNSVRAVFKAKEGRIYVEEYEKVGSREQIVLDEIQVLTKNEAKIFRALNITIRNDWIFQIV